MAAGAFVSADSDFEDNRVSGRVERVELAVVHGNENDMLVTAAAPMERPESLSFHALAKGNESFCI